MALSERPSENVEFEPSETAPEQSERVSVPESRWLSLSREPEDILKQFSPEQQQDIRYKLRILSSLAQFIGKDFKMPVELNDRGGGWHWDFKENKVRVDPQDLLDKPMEYLRFVISHEGGHRRISRTDFIPLTEWRQPGFALMMNAIEDPRDNNFVAESYPRFRDQMKFAYEANIAAEQQAASKAKADLGFKPRFMQAGLEYIKQWFRETQDLPFEVNQALPEDVKAVVEKTLASAQDSWWRYPTRPEADRSEALITTYAKTSYEINRDDIWPEFQKLVEADQQDQQLQEALKEMQQQGRGEEQSDQSGPSLPPGLTESLSPKQQQEFAQAIEAAIEQAKQQAGSQESTGEPQLGQEGKPSGQPSEASGEARGGQPYVIDLDSLSEELKQKLRDYIDSLPDEQKRALTERAAQALKDFEDELNEELGGKMADTPAKKAQREEAEAGQPPTEQPQTGGDPSRTGATPEAMNIDPALLAYRERLDRELNRDGNLYEQTRREMLPVIDKLEAELREIFVARQAKGWQSGFPTGKRIDMKRRIQEKAKDIPAMESKAWQKRELPSDVDYAVLLLVDLSGSMRQNGKIQESFRLSVVLTEVLNRLLDNVAVVGFNDQLYDYQDFGNPMSNQIRERMGGMFKEVDDSCCKACGNEHSETDLGWATEIAADRLARQKAGQKFLITLSDAELAESPNHPRAQYEPGTMIKNAEANMHVIGLGPGRRTEAMSRYYRNKVVNAGAQTIAEQLPELLRQLIEGYDRS